MRIVPIGVDRNGNINMEELKQKAQDNKNECALSRMHLQYSTVVLHPACNMHSYTEAPVELAIPQVARELMLQSSAVY